MEGKCGSPSRIAKRQGVQFRYPIIAKRRQLWNPPAALAKEKKADLVTGDPEFRQLHQEIKIHWLK